MKLAEAVQSRNIASRYALRGYGRDDLPQLFVDCGYDVGAEIGVYAGDYTKKLLDAGLKVYGIDPWSVQDEFKPSGGQERLDRRLAHAEKQLAPYSRAQIMKKTSMEAVRDFEDESLDFVYIDGNHRFKYVAEDIYEWSKKVRPGGVVAGHDYFIGMGNGFNACHVKYVVNAYVATFHIPKFYVLSGVDKWSSWFWVKPE
jgi:hypothetical protein